MERHHPTVAHIHLERLTRNMSRLQELVGSCGIWPAIKANAYGHGAELIARHLLSLGYRTLCVAHVREAVALIEAGVDATFVLLSTPLPVHAEAIVSYGLEPRVCTRELIEAVSSRAMAAGKSVSVHVMIDTGMRRIGVEPGEALEFLDCCRSLPGLRLRGIMSHFPRADEADKTYSLEQIARFTMIVEAAASYGLEVRHMANSAAILDLPSSHFDVVRPGIAIYGLRPSREIANSRMEEFEAVLEWKSRITFLKEVPAATGLSYGHAYYTKRPSLIATVPVGYGDGLARRLSNDMQMLVGGSRCPQVGRITMDQTLIDVTDLRGRVNVGDEVVIIGGQGSEEITADELARKLGTINYEIVARISSRVPRVAL